MSDIAKYSQILSNINRNYPILPNIVRYSLILIQLGYNHIYSIYHNWWRIYILAEKNNIVFYIYSWMSNIVWWARLLLKPVSKWLTNYTNNFGTVGACQS